MVQQVKAHAAEPDDLRLIPRIHQVEEGKWRLVIVSDFCTYAMHEHMHTVYLFIVFGLPKTGFLHVALAFLEPTL